MRGLQPITSLDMEKEAKHNLSEYLVSEAELIPLLTDFPFRFQRVLRGRSGACLSDGAKTSSRSCVVQAHWVLSVGGMREFGTT